MTETTHLMQGQKFLTRSYWYFFAALVMVLTFLCFFRLGDAPVQDWDEARHGANAFEMMQKQNFIANYYGGNLDYWNLKPPLSYYLVMLGYRLCGFNAWGLRFFSALSYLALAVVITLYLKQRLGKLQSLLALVMFCGMWPLFSAHCVRSGDADSAFLLCVGVALIALEMSSRKPYYLALCGGMFACAFLLKSWHAFVLAPIVLGFFLWTKQYKTLKVRHYLVAVASTLVPILIWAVARLIFDGTAFFHEMLFYDLLKRSSNAIEGHVGGILFYPKVFAKNFIAFFCLVVCLVGVVLKLIRHEKFSPLEKMCILSFVFMFAIYAVAKTKIGWYIFPCYLPVLIGAVDFGPQIWATLIKKRWLQITAVGMVSLLLMAGVVVSGFAIKRNFATNELQNFIATMEVGDGAIYYQEGDQTTPSQSVYLCVQWRARRNVENGGYDKFLQQPGAYLLVSKDFVKATDMPAQIKILQTSDNYVLCYHQ